MSLRFAMIPLAVSLLFSTSPVFAQSWLASEWETNLKNAIYSDISHGFTTPAQGQIRIDEVWQIQTEHQNWLNQNGNWLNQDETNQIRNQISEVNNERMMDVSGFARRRGEPFGHDFWDRHGLQNPSTIFGVSHGGPPPGPPRGIPGGPPPGPPGGMGHNDEHGNEHGGGIFGSSHGNEHEHGGGAVTNVPPAAAPQQNEHEHGGGFFGLGGHEKEHGTTPTAQGGIPGATPMPPHSEEHHGGGHENGAPPAMPQGMPPPAGGHPPGPVIQQPAQESHGAWGFRNHYDRDH